MIMKTYNNMLIIHASNITGKGRGAYELMKSLVPAIERLSAFHRFQYVLPEGSTLADLLVKGSVSFKKRWLPNAMSRTFECLFEFKCFEPATLLTMGDLPLVYTGHQILYLHRPHYVEANNNLKDSFSRFLLRRNLKYVDLVVVQTESMKSRFKKFYPNFQGVIKIVNAPPPQWFLDHSFIRNNEFSNTLRCFYPALGYPHKNHQALLRLLKTNSLEDFHFSLTVHEDFLDFTQFNVDCLGQLNPHEIIRAYENSDVMLFLSLKESYGLPLVEAMYCGLQIIAPDLPYARDLCGDKAIYFKTDDDKSLLKALDIAKKRYQEGFITDWTDRLNLLCKTWDNVIMKILAIE